MSPSQGAAFRRALVTDFDSISAKLAAVDLRRAQSADARVLHAVFGAVEATEGGVGRVNQEVAGCAAALFALPITPARRIRSSPAPLLLLRQKSCV